MFIDYLTLVMVNLVAGLVILAYYVWKGMDAADQRPYAAAFFGVGLISLLTGLHISFTWPLPGAYNIGFGDTTTLFGIVFLMASIALWKGWDLKPVSMYAFFAGLDAVIVGLRIYNLQLTQSPIVSTLGFVLAGLCGIGAAPFMIWFKNNKTARLLGALLLLAAAAVWFVTLQGSAWSHMETFSKYLPPTLAK